MTKEQFISLYVKNLSSVNYKMHDQYNLFSGIDESSPMTPDVERIINLKQQLIRKYEIFSSVAKTCNPKSIIELGMCMASGADAYMFGAENAQYHGYDKYPYSKDNLIFIDNLIKARGYDKRFGYTNADVRSLRQLPPADMVVVDADHSFYHAYNDLCLAMTAKPEWIWADDATETTSTMPAVERFIYDYGECKYMEICYGEKRDNIDWHIEIDFESPHLGGGRLIHLKY